MGESEVRFGRYSLRPAERRLLCGGEPVALGPRAFDLLCALARRGGRVATKDELLAEVWAGVVVEDANLHVQVSQIRRAIGADAIENLPGRGYRLAAATRPPDEAPTRRLSVIVLPFVEPEAPAGQAYFADAVTDDITTQLSRIRGSFVIGSSTALALGGQAIDLAAVAREFGVRYALQGRIERGADRLEVTARLADVATLGVLWADTVTVADADLRAMRREVVARLAAALDLELMHAEAERSRGSPAPQVADLVMQARDPGWRTFRLADWRQPLKLVEAALRVDPDDPDALVESARLLVIATIVEADSRAEQLLARADEQLAAALAVDPANAHALHVLAMLRKQQYRLEEALLAVTRALEWNPNLPRAHSMLGELLTSSGRPEAALPALERALQLSPRDPTRGLTAWRLGRAHLLAGNAAAACAWFERVDGPAREWAMTPLWLAAAQVSNGAGEAGVALYRAQREAILAALRWIRSSDHPGYLARWRRCIAEPLVLAGAEPGFDVFDAWLERQRRHGL